MSWQRIPLDHSLGAYCADWDALNDRYYGGHPFRDSRFTEAMLRHFGTGTEQLFIHRARNDIDGLVILRARGFGIWRQFVPDQLQASPLLISDVRLIDELFDALPFNAWMIELLNQDPDFARPGLMDGSAVRHILPHALTINVSLEDGFDDYWKGRSSNLVKNIRRYSNRVVSELGSTDLRVIAEPDAMQEAIKRYGELESNGWKERQGTAVSIENVQGHFYSDLISDFAGTGQARVFEFWLGGRLAASRLMIDGAGMTVILKTAYDEDMSRFSPGRLQLHEVLKYLFQEKRYLKVEFYTNATQDQLAWATGQRVINHVTCFRRPWQAALYDAYHRIKVGIKRGAEADETAASRVTVFEQCSELPKECKALFDDAELGSFDLGADWFDLLTGTALHAGEKTRFYVLSQGAQVRCVLPLLVGSHRVTGLTSFYTSLYRPLIAHGVQPDELAVVLRQVLRDCGAYSIRFDAMDPSHPSYEIVYTALRLAGLKPYSFFAFGNWYLPVSGQTYAQYFSELPSQIRNTIKRRTKRFITAGLGRMEIVTGGEALDEAILAWSRIYQSSWKVPEPYAEFMPELIRLCARRSWLRLGLAYFDGKPIAAQVWIVNHGRAAIYKLAYDEAHAQHSAGTLLTAYLMQHVLDVDKVSEVDYLIGDDVYKKDWVSHRRQRWGIVAYNLMSVRGAVGCGIQSLGMLRRRHSKKHANGSSLTQAAP